MARPDVRSTTLYEPACATLRSSARKVCDVSETPPGYDATLLPLFDMIGMEAHDFMGVTPVPAAMDRMGLPRTLVRGLSGPERLVGAVGIGDGPERAHRVPEQTRGRLPRRFGEPCPQAAFVHCS